MIRATSDETGEMVEHAHEAQIEETGHASETETFTDGRVVCISNPHRCVGVRPNLFVPEEKVFTAATRRIRLGKTVSCTNSVCMAPARQDDGNWRWPCRVAFGVRDQHLHGVCFWSMFTH